jgi:predicted nucleotide-binding protein (sugar kinase/HSP70/actin superfamily)
MNAELQEAIALAARASDQTDTYLRDAYRKADPVAALIVYELVEAQAKIDIRIRALQEALAARAKEQEQEQQQEQQP